VIFYYKIFDNKDNFLGIATSYDLRYYNEVSNCILCCNENLAQYIFFNDKMYRVNLFKEESKKLKNKYHSVSLKLATQAEYEKYIEEQEKEKSV
jgi:hypothetical protein